MLFFNKGNSIAITKAPLLRIALIRDDIEAEFLKNGVDEKGINLEI